MIHRLFLGKADVSCLNFLSLTLISHLESIKPIENSKPVEPTLELITPMKVLQSEKYGKTLVSNTIEGRNPVDSQATTEKITILESCKPIENSKPIKPPSEMTLELITPLKVLQLKNYGEAFVSNTIESHNPVDHQVTIEKITTLEDKPIDSKHPLELITILKSFLKRKNIAKHIEETIPDSRNEDLITYTKQSIIMSALTIFLFRMGSGNKFDNDSHDQNEKYSKKNMAKFINAPEDRVPVIKTIETFLKNLKEESINDLMIAFFKDLQQSKFFRQHPQLMLGDFFLLAADCVHTHTYSHPHHIDNNGNNNCDCCLKRVYNKGTANETTKWMHNTLVFSFVFIDGLKLPIYRYPIHAKQIVNLESASEDQHKQESELVALKIALPIIRKHFPRMSITLLLDGLYANRPVMRLAEEHSADT